MQLTHANNALPERGRTGVDAAQYKATMEKLRPFMTEARAQETEAILKRMYDRAQAWHRG